MTAARWTELAIFVVLFGVVSALGFVAARWKAADNLNHLDEWGLGGRRFGAWVTWFLIGGDIYTAYTFVAVPALVAGAGALGFYALPYTVILYPIVLLPAQRLWSVSRANGYVTPADFVRGRHGSALLALLIAITGIVATMPYIALQLAGLEAVLRTIGLNAPGLLGHLPLFVAFVILALYTYSSGLRAPALIAFVKDILIYLVIIVAVVYLPVRFGGWDHIFNTVAHPPNAKTKPIPILLNNNNSLQYATLALGSALALFLYPHSITGLLAARGRAVIRKNMVALPAYSVVLGLLALLGFVAVSAGIKADKGPSGKPDTNTIVPELFAHSFPSWFAGIAFAAIGIGALVPAAIMSIAAANLWTRNIYKAYLRRAATPAQEARQAKIASLVVKFGAVLFVVAIDPAFSIDLQLIGGVLILQTLPAVAIALYTRWLHVWGLVAGWLVGLGWGVYLMDGTGHFTGTALAMGKLSLFGWHPFGGSTVQIYVGVVALVANLVVAVVVTLVVRAIRVPNGRDDTSGAQYHEDTTDDRELIAVAD